MLDDEHPFFKPAKMSSKNEYWAAKFLISKSFSLLAIDCDQPIRKHFSHQRASSIWILGISILWPFSVRFEWTFHLPETDLWSHKKWSISSTLFQNNLNPVLIERCVVQQAIWRIAASQTPFSDYRTIRRTISLELCCSCTSHECARFPPILV